MMRGGKTEPRQDIQLLRLSQDRDMKTMSQGSLKTRQDKCLETLSLNIMHLNLYNLQRV